MTTTEPEIPDLRSLLAEATRPAETVTIPLNQALAAEIRALVDELADLTEGSPRKRMGAPSPLKDLAKRIEAKREEMRASEVTFRFEAMTHAQREQIRKDMGGRDEPDEVNLRAIAAMCVSPTGVTWETLRELRDKVGVNIFDLIDEAANRASGVNWSIPFSSAASHILETAR
jgi:hypothetical protein